VLAISIRFLGRIEQFISTAGMRILPRYFETLWIYGIVVPPADGLSAQAIAGRILYFAVEILSAFQRFTTSFVWASS
jgi:hypothetical protein